MRERTNGRLVLPDYFPILECKNLRLQAACRISVYHKGHGVSCGDTQKTFGTGFDGLAYLISLIEVPHFVQKMPGSIRESRQAILQELFVLESFQPVGHTPTCQWAAATVSHWFVPR